MNEVLKIEIATICIVHIIAVVLAIIFFMYFYMKAKKDSSLYAFLVMQVSIIGWMIFKIFKTVSPTEIARWWFIVGYYFCTCLFEVTFLEFIYNAYKGERIKPGIRYFLYTIAFIQFSWVLTNPLHNQFYSYFDFWRDSFGFLFYIHTVIVYLFIGTGFYYGCKIFKDRFEYQKLWYKLIIASAVIFPLVLNFLYITKFLHRFIFGLGLPVIFDITPIVFVFSTMVFVYATLNHDFIDLSPVMKHEILYRLDTALCVMDSSFEVIYVNEKLHEIFLDQGIEKLNLKFKVLEFDKFKNDKTEVEIENRIFSIYVNQVNAIEETQYLITFNEISEYKSIESKIKQKQHRLLRNNSELEKSIEKLRTTSRIGARNFVARELHDIIGHSLVVTIKLLEVAKLYAKKNRKLSADALHDSVLSIESGIEAMNNIALKDGSYTGEELKKDIDKILDRLRNTNMNGKLSFKGLYYNIDEKTYDIINRIILELVTNALKHSKTKEMFVSINIKQEEINIIVMDNGIGVKDLVLGNGLRGIKERVQIIGGKVEYITS